MAWAPDYVTLTELKSFMRIPDTSDDTELALAITAASRAVDKYCGRQFGKVASSEERLFTAEWDRHIRRWVVELDDLSSASGLTVECTAGTITAYTLEPVNALKKSRPYERLVVDIDSATVPTTLRNDVALTSAQWGWAAVPTPVELATLQQAHRFHARRFSPYGVAGSPALGSESRLLATLDAEVKQSLGDFVRWWAAA